MVIGHDVSRVLAYWIRTQGANCTHIHAQEVSTENLTWWFHSRYDHIKLGWGSRLQRLFEAFDLHVMSGVLTHRFLLFKRRYFMQTGNG